MYKNLQAHIKMPFTGIKQLKVLVRCKVQRIQARKKKINNTDFMCHQFNNCVSMNKTCHGLKWKQYQRKGGSSLQYA